MLVAPPSCWFRDETHGTKRLRHALVGEFELAFKMFTLPGDRDEALVTYTAEPGSPSATALELLALTERSEGSG